MARPEGALIAKVLTGSPAEKAGIQVGDIVLSYNGQPVYRSSDLPPIVGNSPAGRQAKVEVLRSQANVGDGVSSRKIVVQVVTGELPMQRNLADLNAPPQAPDRASVLGAQVIDISAERRKQLELPANGGILVAKAGKGPLKRAGVETGDIILKLNHAAIENSRQFAKLAADLPTDKNVALYLFRKGAPQFLALKITKSETK